MKLLSSSVILIGFILASSSRAIPLDAASMVNRSPVVLETVRPSWPVAREPAGQWGVVGEVVVRHSLARPAVVTAVDIAMFDAGGSLLSHERHDSPAALSAVLRVARTAGSDVGWKPPGSVDLADGESAVVFVAALVPTRPASAAVAVTLDDNAGALASVPLEPYRTGQALAWPTRAGAHPWIATSTPGTPPHSQGGAVFDGKALFVSQRFALDLRQVDGRLRTHPVGATRKEQYYAWGEEVLSMGRGRVVAVVNDDPDYEIGETPPWTQHPAGNHVVIEHGRGEYGVYAHLQRGSVIVSRGERVERGQPLALVGNSGSSSEPHLHVHMADRWKVGNDPVASFVGSQGVPLLLWGGLVLRDGSWRFLRGTSPLELDIVVPAIEPW